VIVAANRKGRIIWQVSKGAAYRVCRGITDRGEDCAGSQTSVSNWGEVKLRAGLDRDAIGDHLVCRGSLGVELIGISGVGFEGESALKRQCGRPVRVDARLQECS